MFFLRECVNAPHTFTLRDGTVFRIGPQENSEPFEESLVSNEVLFAESMGIVSLIKAPTMPTPTPVVIPPEPESVPREAPEVDALEPTKPTTPRLRQGSGKK